MNRRQFIQRAGLGGAALFLLPAIAAAGLNESELPDQLRDAVNHLLHRGADYADGRAGTCEVLGHEAESAPLTLLDSEHLIGLRYHIDGKIQHLLLKPRRGTPIEEQIDEILALPAQKREQPELWTMARFQQKDIVARHSSDSTQTAALQMQPLRYIQARQLPAPGDHHLFCDILIDA